eukprot:s130_g8.t1
MPSLCRRIVRRSPPDDPKRLPGKTGDRLLPAWMNALKAPSTLLCSWRRARAWPFWRHGRHLQHFPFPRGACLPRAWSSVRLALHASAAAPELNSYEASRLILAAGSVGF